MLEDVVDWKALFPQRPTLNNAACLIGRTQQYLNTYTIQFLSGFIFKNLSCFSLFFNLPVLSSLWSET